MARTDHLTGDPTGHDDGLDPSARQLLDGWLNDLARRLSGPARARTAILAELRDGLSQATADQRTAGLPPDRAAEAAVAEFGDPTTTAAAFAPELAAARARRTGLALLASGPLMAAAWLAAIATGTGGLPPWQQAPTGPWVALPLLGALVGIGTHAALLAVAATGRSSRWLPGRPRLAPTAAATAALACTLGDLAGLTLLAIQATASPDGRLWAPAVAAAAASATRLVLAGRAAHHRLHDRAALT